MLEALGRACRGRGLVACDALRSAFAQMQPRLERFPRVSGRELRRRLTEVCPLAEETG